MGKGLRSQSMPARVLKATRRIASYSCIASIGGYLHLQLDIPLPPFSTSQVCYEYVDSTLDTCKACRSHPHAELGWLGFAARVIRWGPQRVTKSPRSSSVQSHFPSRKLTWTPDDWPLEECLPLFRGVDHSGACIRTTEFREWENCPAPEGGESPLDRCTKSPPLLG